MRIDGFRGDYWDDRFVEAALEPALWMPVLQEVADATGSSRAELVGFGPEMASFNWVTSADDRMHTDFQRAGGGSPSVNFRIAADGGMAPLQIVDEMDYERARREMVRDDYIDFCEQHRIPFGCQTCLARDDKALIGFSILRTRADGHTSAEGKRLFAQAAGAAQKAVRLQRRIERQGVHLLAGSLEAMALSCLLLDGLGIVQEVTPAAERLLAAHPLVTVADHRLSGRHPETRRRIDLALRNVLGSGGHSHERVLFHGSEPVPQLVLEIFRLPAREWAMHFGARAIVILQDPHANAGASVEALQIAFGLTPAEAQVAVAMAKGQSREAIAAARTVSLETVRAQVKSLYQKTGCRREAELALLVKALIG